MIDEIDHKILAILQEKARIPVPERRSCPLIFPTCSGLRSEQGMKFSKNSPGQYGTFRRVGKNS